MLSINTGPKLAVGQCEQVDRFPRGELAVGGNFVRCLIIVVIFLGLGGAYRLAGDFKLIIWSASHEGMGPFLWGGVHPSRHHVKILISQLQEGWLDEMVKKQGREGFYISCTISVMVKILLVKLKNLYIQYASIMKKQNSNQNVKVQKIVVFAKTFDHYHHKFNFGNLFSCLVEL